MIVHSYYDRHPLSTCIRCWAFDVRLVYYYYSTTVSSSYMACTGNFMHASLTAEFQSPSWSGIGDDPFADHEVRAIGHIRVLYFLLCQENGIQWQKIGSFHWRLFNRTSNGDERDTMLASSVWP